MSYKMVPRRILWQMFAFFLFIECDAFFVCYFCLICITNYKKIIITKNWKYIINGSYSIGMQLSTCFKILTFEKYINDFRSLKRLYDDVNIKNLSFFFEENLNKNWYPACDKWNVFPSGNFLMKIDISIAIMQNITRKILK